MGFKEYTAYALSERNMTRLDFSKIIKKPYRKELGELLRKNERRCNQSKLTVRHHNGGNRRKYRLVDFRIAVRKIIMSKSIVMNGDKVKNGVSNCLPMSENSVCTRGDDCIETRINIMPFRKKSRIKKHLCRKSAVSYPTAGGDKFARNRKKLGRLWETVDRLLKVTQQEFSSGYSHLAVFNDCQITAKEVGTSLTSVIDDRIYTLTNNAEVVMTKRIQHNMFAV